MLCDAVCRSAGRLGRSTLESRCITKRKASEYVAVHGSALQNVAVCCSALQCVEVRCSYEQVGIGVRCTLSRLRATDPLNLLYRAIAARFCGHPHPHHIPIHIHTSKHIRERESTHTRKKEEHARKNEREYVNENEREHVCEKRVFLECNPELYNMHTHTETETKIYHKHPRNLLYIHTHTQSLPVSDKED